MTTQTPTVGNRPRTRATFWWSWELFLGVALLLAGALGAMRAMWG